MKNITDAAGKRILNRLQGLIDKQVLRPTDAWACFSKPKPINVYSKCTVNLTDAEIESLNGIRKQVKEHLKKKINKRCAYCKRAMGQHGFSWNIEHVRGKTKHPKMTFLMSNLTYACVDCNLVKNNAVDNKRKYVFDIIDPNSKGFKYGDNIGFLQLSTDSIHILKYKPISDVGINTYKKLRFDELEQVELLSSLNEAVGSLCDRIDERILDLSSSEENLKLARFLQEMKFKLV